jgi:hypothetical protein
MRIPLTLAHEMVRAMLAAMRRADEARSRFTRRMHSETAT